VNRDGSTAPLALDTLVSRKSAAGRVPAVETVVARPAVPPAPSSRRPLLLAAAAVGALALATGGAVAVMLSGGDGDKDDQDTATRPEPVKKDAGNADVPARPKSTQEKRPANPEDPVNRAIDRGVAYLRSYLNGQQSSFRSQSCGAHALAGLTLLSCGVPATDPAVLKVIQRVRGDVPRLRATYEMSICIWFLDRLNDPQDQGRIRTLALRLIAGQMVNGGWNYTCRPLNEQQCAALDGLLHSQSLSSEPSPEQTANAGSNNPSPKLQDKAPSKPAKGGKKKPARPKKAAKGGKKKPAQRKVPPPLPADLKNLPVMRFQPGQRLAFLPPQGHEDNSLTQFAILALWAAQKHGVAAERSLAMAEARFRGSQNRDGSWGYALRTRQRPDSMTCAGLLGLAVGRGLLQEIQGKKPAVPALMKDPVVRKGFAFLSRGIGRAAVPGPGKGRGSLIRAQSLGDLYYLWSLERVGVVYNLTRINGKDWYAWGSKVIVDKQQADGSWQEAYPGVVDTCLALLFLKRVNVAQDLTAALQKLEIPSDPVP
jgi:hypothetical protein